MTDVHDFIWWGKVCVCDWALWKRQRRHATKACELVMDLSLLKKILFLDFIFFYFCVLRAQKCPSPGAMPVALWRAGLLLCFLSFCAGLGEMTPCLIMHVTHTHKDIHPPLTHWCCFTSLSPEEECVLGVLGRPVILPCLYPKLLSFVNFTIEWRRGDEVVLRSVWELNKKVEELSVNSATISSDAAMTGNFSLELPTVDLQEYKMNYSLFIISEEDHKAALCTACLMLAGQCQTHRK